METSTPIPQAPAQDSIQLNKLKMAFDIALSSSLSSSSYRFNLLNFLV